MKTYILTNDEMYIIRDALIEYYQLIKNTKSNSPIAIRQKALLIELKNQFKQDVLLMKEDN